jgi:hypothetical protein
MPNVFATKNGNWSDTTVWNTLALPTVNDDVFANNFTVYVDNSYRVLSVRNTSATGITAGGRFILNNGVSLSAFAVGGGATGIYCVQALSAVPSICTLVGNLCADNIAIAHPCVFLNSGTGTATVIGSFITPARNSGVNSSAAFIANNGSGILNLFGNYSGCSTGGVLGIINNSSGTINLVGSLSGLVSNSIGNGLNNQSTGTVNITGNCFGFGDINNGARAVQNGSIGTINIIGDVYGPGAFNSSTGTINLTGNCFGRASTNSHAVQNSSTGIITLRGNALGGTGTTAYGVNNNSGGIVLIDGNAIAGTGSTAYGAFNNATGFMYVRGNAIGNGWGLGSLGIGGAAPGIFGSQTGTTIVQSLCCGARGQWPTAGNIFVLPLQNSTMTYETSAFQEVTLFTSFSANITPPVSSVRLGTRYNLNDYTGTCAIPSISSVLQGVAVDNSIGIATLQPQTVWSVQTSAIDTNSLGGRLKESATVQSFGQLLTAFNT